MMAEKREEQFDAPRPADPRSREARPGPRTRLRYEVARVHFAAKDATGGQDRRGAGDGNSTRTRRGRAINSTDAEREQVAKWLAP